MSRVGIITYHNTTNYGALLQSFALQSKLKEVGASAEVINYHCKNIEEREFVVFPKFTTNIICYLRNVKRYFEVLKKRKIMQKFIKQNVSISAKEYDRNTIKYSIDYYDKFVVGSDMVFELGINGGDFTYYLDFAPPEKRYSYAACLGVERIDDKYLTKCQNELEKFESISVREEYTKDYLKKIINKDVHIDLDPTLLYDSTFWEQYEENPKNIKDKGYILLYFIGVDTPEFKVASKIAKEKNLDIYIIMNYKKNIPGCKVIYNATVGEFLYYIHHASLVITASFHGMIFSMNYNTNFMYSVGSRKPISLKLNNMAKMTNTLNRELKDDSIPEFECDFDETNEIIKEYREKSIRYLEKIVKDKGY